MPDGMVRMNCEGLLAIAIKDTQGYPDVVERVDFIFLDPEKTLPNMPAQPEAHRPRLEIEDANLIDWSRTTLRHEPNITPLSFPLTNWRVTVRPDGGNPGGNVQWPQVDRVDPDAGGTLRVLSSQKRLLDLKSICGEGALNADFLKINPPHAQVVGFLTLEAGVVFTMSLNTGGFDEWAFDGITFKQQAADSLALFIPADEFVTFHLTLLTNPAITETVTVKCKNEVSRIKLKHTCRSTDSCKKHKGNHVAQYYEMATPIPAVKPRPLPPVSESSYCPPARFSQT